MLANKKAIIFDLDGTLIDSMWVWKDVDDCYIEKYHIIKPANFHEVMEGMSYTEVAQYFRDEFKLTLTVDEIKQEWLEMTIDRYRDEVQLKPCVKELLEMLRSKGLLLGIATSSTKELVNAVLQGHGILQYFDAICTSCEVNTGKPAPDVYLRVAELLKVDPVDCLVFEDVPKGVMAGKNAGMQVAAVEDAGNLSQRKQLRELADYYISTYHEVLENTYEVL